MKIAIWSEFAREGKKYSDMLKEGHEILILHNSKPLAVVRPIDPDDVVITVAVKEPAP